MNGSKCDKCLMFSNWLIRQNPKGQKGIFYCENCNQKPVDKEVSEICNVIKDSK